MLPEYFEFTLPTKVIYGIGILNTIGNSVKHFGERRAVLVTMRFWSKPTYERYLRFLRVIEV